MLVSRQLMLHTEKNELSSARIGVRERAQRRMVGRDAPRNFSRYDKEKERDRQIGKSTTNGGIKTLDAPELHCHLKSGHR